MKLEKLIAFSKFNSKFQTGIVTTSLFSFGLSPFKHIILGSPFLTLFLFGRNSMKKLSNDYHYSLILEVNGLWGFEIIFLYVHNYLKLKKFKGKFLS